MEEDDEGQVWAKVSWKVKRNGSNPDDSWITREEMK
jgi:hypothetical protein